MSAIIATTALLATTAIAGSVGSAVVINKCNYDVTLCAVPAQFGGYEEVDETLSSGDTFTQEWTQLTNNDGWSIKLSNSTSLEDILQYEYTFQNDGTIWYDLSEVNGNPWDGNWEITAESEEGTCSPKQQAYRYATDDAYGMQACPQDSTITVTLCSGESQDDGPAASASSSVAALSSSLSTAAVSSYSTPASTPATTWTPETLSSTTEAPSTPLSTYEAPASTEASSAPVQTTFATSVSSAAVVSTQAGGVTVTEVETAVVTNWVTYTHWHHGGRGGKRAVATGARHHAH